MNKIKAGDIIRINTAKEHSIHLNGQEFVVEYAPSDDGYGFLMNNKLWGRNDFEFVRSGSRLFVREMEQPSHKISTISETIKRLEMEWEECDSKKCSRTLLMIPSGVPKDRYDYVKGVVYYEYAYNTYIFLPLEE